MGTHSTVKFYNRRGHCILAIYNQYDGYITGVGKELVEFLEDENWKGNGFDDTALLYVCFKKQGKPYHTYATVERDVQEFNYEIHDTEDGLVFNITEEKWLNDTQEIAYVNTLRWGNLQAFKDYIKETEIKEEEMRNANS